MITLELTEEQVSELYQVAMFNEQPRNRKKALIVYLRSMGRSCHEVAKITRADKDTVTNYLKKYASGGLQGLLAENYRHPKSCLEPHTELLKKLFEQQPPHTANQASDMIFVATGLRLKQSACRDFLKRLV